MEPPRSSSPLRGLDGDEQQDSSPASVVQYQEPGDNDDEDEDEQLFIETIRRGALAVQQRRRRLLDGRPRRRAEPLPQSNGDGSSGSSNMSEEATMGISSQPSASYSRSLHPTSLLAAHLNATASTSQTTGNRDRAAAASTSHTVTSPMLLLYCASSFPSASLSVGFQALNATTAPLNGSRENDNITNDTAHTTHTSPQQQRGGGGCGRLICARAFQSKLDPDSFESDAPPSHQLVDWLEIVPARDDETKWPHLCDCVQATLGCRNCGNIVGISTLFRCGPCRRKVGASPSWQFWTSQAMVRTSELPVQVIWEGQMAAPEPDFAQEARQSRMPPTQEQDRVHGLAGEAREWELRSEALFNASPLPTLQREKKSTGRGPTLGMSNEHLLAAVSNTSERLQDIGVGSSNIIGDGRVLERARALRRDLRAYIAQTTARDGGGDASSAYDATAFTLPFEQDSRRRRRSLLGLVEGGSLEHGSSRGRQASDEREFRRRRTAEILESGRERGERRDGDVLSSALPSTIAAGRVFDGLVGR